MRSQHLPDFLLDELPIFGVYERQIFFLRWGVAFRMKPVDVKQLRRPILESSRVECPAASVCKPLSFR